MENYVREIMDMMIDNSIERAEAYKLLAECFYKPENEWFEEGGLLQNLNETLEHLEPGTEFKIEIQEHSISQLEELTVDYAKLFIGPFKLLAPPYGSYYLDGENEVMGDSTIAVKKMYSAFGLEPAEDIKEVPDHIAIELEFMHYLTYKENEALLADDTKSTKELAHAQSEFLMNYLSPFVLQMCKKITEGSENGFYIALAHCLNGFIEREFSKVNLNN